MKNPTKIINIDLSLYVRTFTLMLFHICGWTSSICGTLHSVDQVRGSFLVTIVLIHVGQFPCLFFFFFYLLTYLLFDLVFQYLNIKLTDISVTDPEKYPHMVSFTFFLTRGHRSCWTWKLLHGQWVIWGATPLLHSSKNNRLSWLAFSYVSLLMIPIDVKTASLFNGSP